MKIEAWTFGSCAVFWGLTSPAYWVLSKDPAGTAALVMVTLFALLTGCYLAVVNRQIPSRPEDTKDTEVAEGAGEVGFFPAHSWAPLMAGSALAIAVVGVAAAWWLFVIGAGLLAGAAVYWVMEYYRGVYSH